MSESQQPIPGTTIDPPAKPQADKVRAVERRSRLGAVLYLAILRFGGSHSTLLAGGSTYYLFLGILSAIFLAFGLVARFSTQRLSSLLEAGLGQLREVFPDFVGSQGIDPAALQAWGQGASLISLLVLLYSGTGTINAMSGGLHIVYGAPMDPRNFFLKKLRQVGWLLLLLPLGVLAFLPTVVIGAFGEEVRDWLNVQDPALTPAIIGAAGVVLAISMNYFFFRLVLSRLGGIRPDLTSLRWGALVGAILFEIMRFAMVYIAQWALARPQYGAFALPVAILFVIYLQWLLFFFIASLTAAMASFRVMVPAAEDSADSEQTADSAQREDENGPIPDPVQTTEVLATSQVSGVDQHSTMVLGGSTGRPDDLGDQRTEIVEPDPESVAEPGATEVIDRHSRSPE